MTDEKYGVPAILSFFIPGLGQLIKGEVWKGTGLMLAAFLAGTIGVLILIGFLAYPVIWIYSVYDAYNSQVE